MLEQPAAPTFPETQELRLALVCYGGVSLAIWMHGVTKELHKLVLASEAYTVNPDSNPFPEGCTERVYWDLLDARERNQHLRTRVVIDIVPAPPRAASTASCSPRRSRAASSRSR
jgi:hypothetical protein